MVKTPWIWTFVIGSEFSVTTVFQLLDVSGEGVIRFVTAARFLTS